jgi:hypothetical protein
MSAPCIASLRHGAYGHQSSVGLVLPASTLVAGHPPGGSDSALRSNGRFPSSLQDADSIGIQKLDEKADTSMVISCQNLIFNSTHALLGAPGAKKVALWEGVFPAYGPLA